MNREPATIHHLHRVVRLPVRTLDDIAREYGVEAQHRPDAWPYDESECVEDMLGNRPSTLQRIGDALGSPFGLGLYLGFYAGCIVTVAAAYLWSLG